MKTKNEILEEIKRLNAECDEADELMLYSKCEEIKDKLYGLKWVIGETK